LVATLQLASIHESYQSGLPQSSIEGTSEGAARVTPSKAQNNIITRHNEMKEALKLNSIIAIT